MNLTGDANRDIFYGNGDNDVLEWILCVLICCAAAPAATTSTAASAPRSVPSVVSETIRSRVMLMPYCFVFSMANDGTDLINGFSRSSTATASRNQQERVRIHRAWVLAETMLHASQFVVSNVGG